MIDAAQIGLRLRAARERFGLSQQEAADALKLPRTAVTHDDVVAAVAQARRDLDG